MCRKRQPPQAMPRADFKQWLGEVVLAGRIRLGCTQAQLAHALGWPRAKAKLSRIEHGYKPIPPARAAAFERVLGLPAGFIENALVNWREHGGDPRHFAPYVDAPHDALATAAALAYLERVVLAWRAVLAREMPRLWAQLSHAAPSSCPEGAPHLVGNEALSSPPAEMAR